MAGLLGAFAAGLYFFAPPTSERDGRQTASEAAPDGPLPAEIAVESAKGL